MRISCHAEIGVLNLTDGELRRRGELARHIVGRSEQRANGAGLVGVEAHTAQGTNVSHGTIRAVTIGRYLFAGGW